jgi:hypothetical protein
MITFEDAVSAVPVEKPEGKPYRPKSRFRTQSPAEATNAINRVDTSAKVPQQSKTKPLKPGEEEDPELSDPYADLGKRAEALGIAIPGLNDKTAAPAATAGVVWDGQKHAAITPTYRQIEDIAKKLQEANPALSDAQAFEKAFLVVVHQQVVAAVRDGLLQVADDVASVSRLRAARKVIASQPPARPGWRRRAGL